MSEWLQTLCVLLALATCTLLHCLPWSKSWGLRFWGKWGAASPDKWVGPPPPSLQAQGGSLLTPSLSLWLCRNLWCLLLVKWFWGRKKPTSAKDALRTVVLRPGKGLQRGGQGFSIWSRQPDKLTLSVFSDLCLFGKYQCYIQSLSWW